MGHKFADIMFTNQVQAIQKQQGSFDNYHAWSEYEDFNYLIDDTIRQFLAQRDSFYMASVNQDDWPYVQHRGGPKGFMKVIDEHTLGFADLSGNRQYVSAGNFKHNDKVSLFFMDYARRRRLKILGRVTSVSLAETDLIEQLQIKGHGAKVERGFIIKVEAYDWNCPKFITQRYDTEQVQDLMARLVEENNALKKTIEALKVNPKNNQ
jgi:predicted pyridoxine 5'-phosphate oxidase superfamily flavin-nucleotide-binding protein